MIAYSAFRRQVELTYFMSISLLAMGILARISYLIDEILPNLSTSYQALLPRQIASMKLPKSILSVQEFTNWNFIKEDISEEQYSTSSVSDIPKDDQNQVESLVISDSFWNKNMIDSLDESKLLKRKSTDSDSDSSRKKKTKAAMNKQDADIDRIFSIFDR